MMTNKKCVCFFGADIYVWQIWYCWYCQLAQHAVLGCWQNPVILCLQHMENVCCTYKTEILFLCSLHDCWEMTNLCNRREVFCSATCCTRLSPIPSADKARDGSCGPCGQAEQQEKIRHGLYLISFWLYGWSVYSVSNKLTKNNK